MRIWISVAVVVLRVLLFIICGHLLQTYRHTTEESLRGQTWVIESWGRTFLCSICWCWSQAWAAVLSTSPRTRTITAGERYLAGSKVTFWVVRVVRDITNCGPNDTVPPNRVNTTQQLLLVRSEMRRVNISLLIVPLDTVGRLKWISGFSGSNGQAVISQEQGASTLGGEY